MTVTPSARAHHLRDLDDPGTAARALPPRTPAAVPAHGAPVAATWWGHASLSLRLGGATVATDPLLAGALYHLRRHAPVPPPEASRADVVVVSHLHHDHLHLPSLRTFDRATPVVVPRGAADVVTGLRRHELVEVSPGDRLSIAGLELEVLPAKHEGCRDSIRTGRRVEPIGFRLAGGGASVWYPGDTGMRDDFADVEPVDLAVVPIGGWGPSLGEMHLDPDEAVTATAMVGARWALAVHYGTYWPRFTERLRPQEHHQWFVTPPERFRRAASAQRLAAVPLTPAVGDSVDLGARSQA